jgi:hypothetical protein
VNAKTGRYYERRVQKTFDVEILKEDEDFYSIRFWEEFDDVLKRQQGRAGQWVMKPVRKEDVIVNEEDTELRRLREIEKWARELMKFDRPFQKTIGGASFWRAWEALREALKEN